MQSSTTFRQLRTLIHRHRNRSSASDPDSLPARIREVISRTWDLGFIAFGGPPVHFQIIHKRFVEGARGKEKWIDEQTYQELFALCQGLPGPASTKMLFCVTMLHAGFIPALAVFFFWSFPGALAMYGLSLGVQRIGDTLPGPVYALLSGLNASTVGIIALAAVQLASKAIKDKISRILVILGACAGICYSALWFFPLLMVIGGAVTVIWDGWLGRWIGRLKIRWKNRSSDAEDPSTMSEGNVTVIENAIELQPVVQRKTATLMNRAGSSLTSLSAAETAEPVQQDNNTGHTVRVKIGLAVVVSFFASFISVMVIRGILKQTPLAFSLFSNMYLAGTIIFGGGPVVVPLLRSYVVDPGWVSNRDFLLGLAIIQAMPGPNFNFAVYLGALALRNSRFPTIFGALISFLGIFFPGLSLAVAAQGFWRVLRRKKWITDLLRGVNATAVGLVFTAVYRLWEIGYLTPRSSRGVSLAENPWWVVVTAVTYAESAWFGMPPALAIMFGAILGLGWYGAVGR